MPTLTEDFKFLLDGNVAFQQMVRDTLPLCSQSERRMLTEVAGAVEQKLKETAPQIAELQKMFEAEMNAEVKDDHAKLEALEKRLEELKQKMRQVPPEPGLPPEPPLPGLGDPAYGRRLADELLGLLPPAGAAAAAPKDPGEVWELMSSDWKIDEPPKGTAKPSAPPSPGKAPPPANPPPRKDKSGDAWELESQDWDDRPPGS
jgi:hypothetical protein